MPQPPWTLDELAHAGAEHLDPDYVATYEAKAGFDPGPDVDALRDLGLDERSTVVDLGCGTGTFTRAVAPHCRRVIAVDVSTEMLDAVRARLAPGTDNVECVQAGFLSYHHDGPPADVVYSRNALHQLPDFWKALALTRLADVLRPGGTLWLRDLVYAFEPQEADDVVEGWLAASVPTPDLGYTAEELATHLQTEHSTFSWLLEPLLDHAGFTVDDVEVERRRTYARYRCTRR